MERNQLILAAVLVLALLIAPHVLYTVLVMKILVFALFASAFNLLLGYGGLLSFGHAAYFGSAAYVTAHTMKVWGVTPEIGIILGALTAAFLGLIFGWLAIRRSGIYFAMVTLAFAQMVYFIALQAPFTGGEDGIQAVPRGELFGLISLRSDMVLYYFVLLVSLAGFWVVYRTIHSPFGQIMKAIRENPDRATSLGYQVSHFKLAAFVISTTVSGVAGAMTAIIFQLASLTNVHWTMSGEVVLMTLLGGMGTLLGPIVGAGVVVALQTYLAPFGAWLTIILGTIFAACVLLFRRGIIGELWHRDLLPGFPSRKTPAELTEQEMRAAASQRNVTPGLGVPEGEGRSKS